MRQWKLFYTNSEMDMLSVHAISNVHSSFLVCTTLLQVFIQLCIKRAHKLLKCTYIFVSVHSTL